MFLPIIRVTMKALKSKVKPFRQEFWENIERALPWTFTFYSKTAHRVSIYITPRQPLLVNLKTNELARLLVRVCDAIAYCK
jgi:hypothetical protein